MSNQYKQQIMNPKGPCINCPSSGTYHPMQNQQKPSPFVSFPITQKYNSINPFYMQYSQIQQKQENVRPSISYVQNNGLPATFIQEDQRQFSENVKNAEYSFNRYNQQGKNIPNNKLRLHINQQVSPMLPEYY